MNKEENLKFIKNFSKISLNKICKETKICRQNIQTGSTSAENVEIVKRAIEKEIAKLYL